MFDVEQREDGKWWVRRSGKDRVVVELPHANAVREWTSRNSKDKLEERWSSICAEAESRGLQEEYAAVRKLYDIFDDAGFLCKGGTAREREQRWQLGVRGVGDTDGCGLQSRVALGLVRLGRLRCPTEFVWRRAGTSRWGRPHIEGLDVAAIDAITLPKIEVGDV